MRGHAGGALSAADILAVLYFAVMDYDPEDPVHRDKLLLSGGHKCLALYGAMVELGVLEPELLKTITNWGPSFPDTRTPQSCPAWIFPQVLWGTACRWAAAMPWRQERQVCRTVLTY